LKIIINLMYELETNNH